VTTVFAHRGAHKNAQENTLDSFRDAVALGVAGVELDVRRSVDGVLVVNHDPSAEGHVIARSTAAALPSYVPTLDAAMEALAGIAVNVEIKNSTARGEPGYDETGAFARQVVDYLRGAGLSDTVSISCFDLRTCVHVRAHDHAIYVAWLLWHQAMDAATVEAYTLGFNALNPNYKQVTREGVEFARKHGLELNIWTVNAKKDLLAMRDLAVTSVITDEPALALALFADDSP
jgi:glycerophosphoryl diester phosphodiesterase